MIVWVNKWMNGTMIQMNEWHNEWIRMVNCVSKQMNEYAWFWRIRMILILKHIFHTHECIICKTKWQHHLRSVLLIFFEGSTLCSAIFLMIFFDINYFFDNLTETRSKLRFGKNERWYFCQTKWKNLNHPSILFHM